MSDVDSRLTAILNANLSKAQDAGFRVEVLVRIERARFKRRVLMTLAFAFAAAVLVVVRAPAIEAWIATDVWRLWAIALGAVIALFSFVRRADRGLPGLRGVARTLARCLYP
jgi:hypothetical protein